MDMGLMLKFVALLGTAVAGLLALLKPASIAGFTGVNAESARAKSEVRAIFGGLLIGLGLAPLWLGTLTAYRVVGIAYCAIAAARAFSLVYDRSLAPSNWISLLVEIVFGVILVV